MKIRLNIKLILKSPKRLIELDDIKNRIYKYPDKLDDSIKYDLENSNFGEFKPPKYGQNTIILGLHGGATWPGSSFNPIDFNLFTPINMIPFVLRIDGKTKSSIEPKAKL